MIRLSAIALFVAIPVMAQQQEVKQLDEVVISDSKFALSKEKSGKIIVTLTAEDLAKKSGQSLATILSSVVGLEVNGNQSAGGKNLSYYIRGARSRQTLILIDGVPVTDASGINLEYDLRLITADQVERIEIMKGASSTLYGSGAAAGVINITLKKTSSKDISGNAYVSLGSQTTADKVSYTPKDFNQGFGFNGTLDKFTYSATINSTETKGISEAKGVNFEEDRFSRTNILTKVGYKPTKQITLDAFVGYDKMKNAFDGTFDNFNNPDTPLNISENKQFRFGFSPKFKYNKGELVVNSGLNSIDRNYNTNSVYTGLVEYSNYQSRSVNVDAFNKYNFCSGFFAVLGGQFQFYEMDAMSDYEFIQKQTAKFNTTDPYINAVINSKMGFNLNAGIRLNNHSIYGEKLVYNVNPSYNFSKLPLKVLASYSTAYITPSLYQLYSPYGNLSLTPEENKTFEAGFEYNLLDKKLTINTVVFHREEKNAIGFTSSYANINGKYNAKGLETMVTYSFSNNLNLNANYAFTQTETALNRLIPKHKVNMALDYQFNTKLSFMANYQWIDKREDAFYDAGTEAPQSVILSAYQIVNANVRYQILKNRLSVFGALNNVFNESFVENIGYNTRGRNYKVGMTILF